MRQLGFLRAIIGSKTKNKGKHGLASYGPSLAARPKREGEKAS
jgi:hypothetical protein